MFSANKKRELAALMDKLQIFEEDIEEKFVRSSGKGGQNVNKVASCVMLHHLPSGIQVKCQKERSQAMNRFHARRLLCEKIEEKLLGKKSAKQQSREKLRRQKRKRSKRAKEKTLEYKKKTSEKKTLRKKVEL